MIVVAALKVSPCSICPFELIVPCLRHGNGYMNLQTLCKDNDDWKKNVTEGFINEEGQFFNRVEAYQEAIRCGQLPPTVREFKKENGEDELYSEDIY